MAENQGLGSHLGDGRLILDNPSAAAFAFWPSSGRCAFSASRLFPSPPRDPAPVGRLPGVAALNRGHTGYTACPADWGMLWHVPWPGRWQDGCLQLPSTAVTAPPSRNAPESQATHHHSHSPVSPQPLHHRLPPSRIPSTHHNPTGCCGCCQMPGIHAVPRPLGRSPLHQPSRLTISLLHPSRV